VLQEARHGGRIQVRGFVLVLAAPRLCLQTGIIGGLLRLAPCLRVPLARGLVRVRVLLEERQLSERLPLRLAVERDLEPVPVHHPPDEPPLLYVLPPA